MRHGLITAITGAIALLGTAHAGYIAPTSSTIYEATSAVTDKAVKHGNSDHSMWAPFFKHIVPDIGPRFDFEPAGIFEVGDNGYARLSGTVVSRDNAKVSANVDVKFKLRDGPGTGGPKKELKKSAYANNGGPIDPDSWMFFDLVDGSFEGSGVLDGVNLTFSQRPKYGVYPLQIGEGANGKNTNLGLSVWFYLAVNDACTSKLCKTLSYKDLYGDFNLDLSEVPLPAGAALFLTGIAGFVGARRARRTVSS